MSKAKTRTVGSAKSKSVFVCQNCGAQRARSEGRCSDCGSWNSFVEETIVSETRVSERQRGWSPSDHSSSGSGAAAGGIVSLNQNIEALKIDRYSTGFGEFDRVLGGGLVQGSFVLLGGDPGIGKSTLLMQMAGGLAQGRVMDAHMTKGVASSITQKEVRILYVSGEESVSQTGLRAQRLGVHSGNVMIASESNLEVIRGLVQEHKPDVLVIDSIQTVFLPELPSAPGSVSQVRECAAQLMGLAKGQGVSVFLIGHVTKEGTIAGPKTLEHMVDTVLSFEGDISHQFRLLRALKNRFGATHELGVFQMDTRGLVEVSNPSELFLEERGTRLIGSAVFASIEGSRPLLCEVQALTTATPMAMPRRTSLGFDVNRVHLLVAVLNKHLGLKLAQADVFINVVGGLRLMEPAADLAVAAALTSTETGVEVEAKTVYFGEIGLTGEIRAVSFAEQRLREAAKLGFTRFVMPYSNKKHMGDLPENLQKQITFVKDVRDLMPLFDVNATRGDLNF
jgi:DNA repair protein RadA/Sms